MISDVLNDSRWEVLAETAQVRSWLGAPLIVGSDVIGILILDDKMPNAYGAETADLVSAFTPQAAIAIQNARLFEEITSSQSQLSEALRIARIGYFEIDLSTDSIIVTDELFELLNTSAEKEGGHKLDLQHTLNKFVFEEDISIATKALQEAIDVHGTSSDLSSEVRYKTADGRIMWVSTVYQVEYDPQGNPTKVAGSTQDITDRKTNELTQVAITHISESALTSRSIEELTKSVHEAIGSLVPGRNFYVALYDAFTKSGHLPRIMWINLTRNWRRGIGSGPTVM